MDINKSDDSLLQGAITYVVSVSQQSGKKKKKPVIFHSLRIGFWLYEQGYDQTVVAGAFLHDVVESYQASLSQIKHKFGGQVARVVEALTVDESIKDPIERFQDSVERCMEIGEEALVVRAADLLENINRTLSLTLEAKQIHKLELQHKKAELLADVFSQHGFDLSIKRRLEQARKQISGKLRSR